MRTYAGGRWDMGLGPSGAVETVYDTVLLRRSSWVVWSWRLELASCASLALPKTRGFVMDGWRHVHFDCHVTSRLAEFPAAVIYPPLSHQIIIISWNRSIQSWMMLPPGFPALQNFSSVP